ncbi:MAG: hypothetical protein FWH37_07240 [Candidatus Bathyarchaeota archaeon]|nr:hypothetical protein [Candidatus Termiticorpusculum sp.]
MTVWGILLRIPKKFHSKVEPVLGVELNVNDTVFSELNGNRAINITLIIKKSSANKQTKPTIAKN